MTATTRRARDDAAKAARREGILDALDALFASEPYESITVAAVAARSGLAKGTVYLYFPTREAMFLALYLRHARAFANALIRIAGGAPAVNAIARAIAGELAARPRFLKLMALAPTVFEQNVTPDVAAAFKAELLTIFAGPAAALEESVASLAGDGFRFLVRMGALAVGLSEMAFPSPAVAEALADPALQPLKLDFEEELAAALAALLRGWR